MFIREIDFTPVYQFRFFFQVASYSSQRVLKKHYFNVVLADALDKFNESTTPSCQNKKINNLKILRGDLRFNKKILSSHPNGQHSHH